MQETALYGPVKRFLESQGYEVKAEIGPADVVAVRRGEPPVIVELKTGFALSLFHQAVDRQSITDAVYIAVARGRGAGFRQALKRNLKLCRRLGLGLITVRLTDAQVVVHTDPLPFKPRRSKRKKMLLLGEFVRRTGDPNVGGATRSGLVTAYRQDAIRCFEYLTQNGATKAARVAEGTGVPNARRIMADNHYGWFRRVDTGVYDVEPAARARRTSRASP